MKKPKITAKQEGGDDGFCYVVRVDGKVYQTGLTRREVPHYKEQALREWNKKHGPKPVIAAIEIGDVGGLFDHPEVAADVLKILKHLAGKLELGGLMLNLGCYGYRPLGGKNWLSSDGGEVTGTMCEIFLWYADRGLIEDLDSYNDTAEELFLTKIRDQQDFESARLCGDAH